MNSSAIADRRQMRRQLTFWRVVAVLLIAALGFGLFRLVSGDMTAGKSRPHIARVVISGLIQDNQELLERLDTIAEDDNVKALVVSISSPGGTTYGGERIFKAIRAVSAEKPVVSDVRTLAASAGYMIATAGDTIIAGETSITGSIGVIFQYPQARELLEKIGVSLEEIKSSPMKAEPSPFHDASEESKAMIRSMVMDSYGWFVDLVADRRKMDRDEALRLANGAIFTGRQALAVHLVDTLGGDDAIRTYLDSRKVDTKLDVIDWEPPSSAGVFGLGSVVGGALKLLGYGDLLPSGDSRSWGSDKLFLDGLVSVWQVGRN